MKERNNTMPATPADSNSVVLSIESLIHVIRGQHVMLDCDLARLYGVETRRLNEQVRRNIERFPDDFMFQLSKDETLNLMSQFATSSWGGTRKLPYVFTENGVAMLSAVLRSKTAIETNIKIMRAFNAMRSFLQANAHIFKRIETLEHDHLLLHHHISETDKKIDEVLTRLDSKESDPIEGFFFEGQIFDAYTLISDLVRKARVRIVVIDNYVDDRILKVLDKRKHGVKATIYTNPRHSHIENDLLRHNEQYPEIAVCDCVNVHDRFLIIDDSIYFIGGSIKDLGKKIVAFSQMHLNPDEILTRIR
ncbi:MAG: ORF6N domain-containing protein [Candidatus Amulumruptor caecigallinarius]|nr:ORF6N domain-containing protein [Candidatus Amulumruptor caecigallinarius]MCM1397085.1 ORF6N domain-containing protein [Candidatus Amulumruptor caecigallinarius]MCM1454071.1 ORF6N domain-containing protein [bacterium]